MLHKLTISMQLNLSLSGCGFLGIYHIGVISAFKEHAPEVIQNKIAGCSAGSLAAACALCDCCLGQMVSDTLEIAMKARNHALGPLHPSFSIVDILRNGLRRILPVDAHKICSGRLFISLTRWRDGKNFLVSQFDSREDLIQALICSSFVPCYSGFIPPKFKGTYYWDGGLSNNNPVLDHNTILVSPFGGEADICPREESASYYCFEMQGTNIQWSKENFYRISKALFPPNPQILKAICFRGYKDAISFLKSRNLLYCSCDRLNREMFSLSSVIGDDAIEFPICNKEHEQAKEFIDIDEEHGEIEEDQIEQYAQSVEPLKFQEMPSPVCEILETACADQKETLISYVYHSKISRAISIMFLPWTLPIEFSITFTKKLVNCLPKINVPNESKTLLDSALISLNLIIQKLTYDKYQYHARVGCNLCLLKNHQHKSTTNKFSITCHHDHNIQNITQGSVKNKGLSWTTSDLIFDKISNFQEMNNNNNTETKQNFNVPFPKLCPRHRLPSSSCFSESENDDKIYRSFKTRKALLMQKNRTKNISESFVSASSNDLKKKDKRFASGSYLTTMTCSDTQFGKKFRQSTSKNNIQDRSDVHMNENNIIFETVSNMEAETYKTIATSSTSGVVVNFDLGDNETFQNTDNILKESDYDGISDTSSNSFKFPCQGTVSNFKIKSVNYLSDEKYDLNSQNNLNNNQQTLRKITEIFEVNTDNERNDTTIDIDSYLDKFELNVLGNINNS